MYQKMLQVGSGGANLNRLDIIDGTQYNNYIGNYSGATASADTTTNSTLIKYSGSTPRYPQAICFETDLTNVDIIIAILEKVTGSVGNVSELQIGIRKTADGEFNPITDNETVIKYSISNDKKSYCFDVSNYVGNHYIFISWGGSINVYCSHLVGFQY